MKEIKPITRKIIKMGGNKQEIYLVSIPAIIKTLLNIDHKEDVAEYINIDIDKREIKIKIKKEVIKNDKSN